MFKISVNTTLKQGTPSIKDEAAYTPAKAISDAGYSGLRGMWMMDGQILTAADLNKPFTELGVGQSLGKTSVQLPNVAKADNA